jgi:hypothetical protein
VRGAAWCHTGAAENASVTGEIKNAGFDLVREPPLSPDQYYLVFQKR